MRYRDARRPTSDVKAYQMLSAVLTHTHTHIHTNKHTKKKLRKKKKNMNITPWKCNQKPMNGHTVTHVCLL